jgi:glycosyltransferase involved in cell wall biosynthesis
MSSDQKKILFITPGAQSFGGNIFLLNFLRWYKRNGGRDFITLYGYPGDLQKDFDELSLTFQYFYSDDSNVLARKAAGKLANKMELRRAFLKSRILREDIGMIYSNAVTNGRMLSMFESRDVPVVSHCHELESLIQLSGIDNFNSLKERTTQFVAVSNAVKNNLVANHNISDEKISVIHAFTPIADLSNGEIRAKRSAARHELWIPDDAFVVGASGTLNWRKAPELFVQLAHAVKSRKSKIPIFFAWIGGAGKDDFRLFELNYDANRLDISDRIRFLEHTSNPLDYFAAIDVFAMVSREDPYPLVCLEAASLGKPVICFADAGGMPEFVEDDCGYVVPYLDISAFATKIIELSSDPEKTKTLGENARKKVRARHDIEVAAPAVTELIEQYFKS